MLKILVFFDTCAFTKSVIKPRLVVSRKLQKKYHAPRAFFLYFRPSNTENFNVLISKPQIFAKTMLQNIIRSLMHIPSGLFLNDTNINVRRTKESQTQKDVEYNFLFFFNFSIKNLKCSTT